MSMGCGNSDAQYSLHSHSVAAVAPVIKETAGTGPLTIFKNGSVNVIFAPERCFKASKLYSLWFFRITLCFFDLSDHTLVHDRYSPFLFANTPCPHLPSFALSIH